MSSKSSSASDSAAASALSASTPVRPSSICSINPPTGVATTGIPAPSAAAATPDWLASTCDRTAVEKLRADGYLVELGVFGEGPLGGSAPRLQALGAEVVNRWLSNDDIASVLARYDAMVLSHVEASQSGVAATAFGAGMPVICTPVGGLPEQVLDGVTGIVARRADGPALADAIMALAGDPQIYNAISAAIVDTQGNRSIARFVEDCVAHARHATPV